MLRYAIYSAPLNRLDAPVEEYVFAGTASFLESNYEHMMSEIGWICILKAFQVSAVVLGTDMMWGQGPSSPPSRRAVATRHPSSMHDPLIPANTRQHPHGRTHDAPDPGRARAGRLGSAQVPVEDKQS